MKIAIVAAFIKADTGVSKKSVVIYSFIYCTIIKDMLIIQVFRFLRKAT